MASPQTVSRRETIEDLLIKARRTAAMGDGPRTVSLTQEAVCLALAALGDDIAALRRELRGTDARV